MKKLIILFTLYALTFLAQAEPELTLRLSRNFGYSSGSGAIQGSFTLKASGPQDLARVDFYLDDQKLGEAAAAPFTLFFITDDYPLGVHTLRAVGFTIGGRELQSNQVKVKFVSAGEGWQAGMCIVMPTLGIILVAVLLAVAMSVIFTRGKTESLPPGTARKYGWSGGAICPECQRPFAMHLYGLNLLTYRFDRCPYCGKWSIVRGVSLGKLRAAEAAELEQARQAEAGSFNGLSEEEKLRREIDASRYNDI